MAQPTNTHSSYDVVSIREDLSNMLHMVEPTKTPFYSMAKKNSATNRTHEWLTDSLEAATDGNAVIEGDDATTDAAIAAVRLSNYTQILDKVPRVTGSMEKMDVAAGAEKMARQVYKRTKEIKRDLESSLLANKAKVAGNDTTARVMAGVPSWIATNSSAGAGGADPTGDGTDARTDGTQRAFTEALLKDVLASCWDEGGEPDCLLVGSFNKQAASAFTGNVQRRQEAETAKLSAAVDVYQSDFGVIKIIPTQFQRARDGLVLQKDMWAVSTLRPLSSWELAKTGDSERRQMLMECTLEACNEKASGIIADLTTS